jgi:UDPglucose 6-dehydrogenase
MNITIIGTGYVGLVTGACMADLGNHVFCLDVDQAKINLLNSGVVPIYEPGLKEVIERNVEAGRLTFSTDVAASVAHGSVQFIAVGTPPDEDGSADLQYVLAAARKIGRHMSDFKVVVDKSTVPVGTADKVTAAINAELTARFFIPVKAGTQPPTFSVVSNPEFLKEGAAIEDFTRPDRIVLGVADDTAGQQALATMRQLYAPFNRNHEPHPRHGCKKRRIHQIRRQRHAGHPHQLYERVGQIGRTGWGRHRAGAPGHRLRPAHWLQLSVCRHRLRR